MSDFAHVTDDFLRSLLECKALGPESFRHAVDVTAQFAIMGLTNSIDAEVPLEKISRRYEIAMDAHAAYEVGDYVACLAHLQKYWLT